MYSATSLPVLIICTRDPRGRLSGRKTVLRTIAESLGSLGHPVTVAYFGPTERALPDDEVQYTAITEPSRLELITGVLRWLLSDSFSLNECLYSSRRAQVELDNTVNNAGIKIVVTDMVRTANFGEHIGLPWVADLDDLLSRRYRAWSTSYYGRFQLLGYYKSPFVKAIAIIASPFLPWILRREANVIERREIKVTEQADVTSLVSSFEAAILAKASGNRVVCSPMAVAGPDALPDPAPRQRELVFLGGLDYAPNLDSVIQFDREVRPVLRRHGLPDLRLHVVGEPGDLSERPPLSRSIVLEGYVEDIDAAMQQYKALLVPEVSRGGVKTKIIVAALNGTLVLAHQSALEGMGLRTERDVFAWDTFDELADVLHRIRRGDFELETVTRSARKWAEHNFGPARLRSIWHENISRALASHRIKSSQR